MIRYGWAAGTIRVSKAMVLIVAVVLAGGASTASISAAEASDPLPAFDVRSERATITHQIWRVLTLRDYNTRVVLLGSTLLGASAGLMGVFLLLRRRSLTADVISHASFPGVALSFLVLEVVSPGSGKSTPALLAGALVSGLAGIACTTLILRYTRIKEDAALAIVLSVFFGLGVALFTMVQSMPTGNAAGLGHFIYGKAASMIAADVWLIAWASLAVLVLFALLFKEWTLVSFDEQFAAAEGWPVLALDLLLVAFVAVVTVVGLQSVGVLLIVALMIIPPVAARFWTYELRKMAIISGAVGAASAVLGVFASALFPRVAAGAVIVLAGTVLFLISLLFGTTQGVIHLALSRYLRDRRIARDHLLRALFECIEPLCAGSGRDLLEQLTEHSVLFRELLAKRTWSAARLRRLIHAVERHGFLIDYGEAGIRFTARGAAAACHVVRNHRLWELYLIEFADRSPSRVDRDADDIEHDLGPEIVTRLERLLAEQQPGIRVPPSPHAIHPTAASDPVK